eukprot:7893654-Pyramimonas_sp.AAC.1
MRGAAIANVRKDDTRRPRAPSLMCQFRIRSRRAEKAPPSQTVKKTRLLADPEHHRELSNFLGHHPERRHYHMFQNRFAVE